MNRVTGLGHRGAAREPMIDQIIQRYRDAGLSRFSVLMALGPQTAQISRWLLKRGFERHGGHRLLLRDLRLPLGPPVAGTRVVKAGRKDAAKVVDIHAEVFASPASRRSWALASSGSPDNQQYLALVGGEAVGVGTLRVEGDLAWLGGGAVRTRWRRRGIHTALILARLRRAVRQGCHWAWVETAEPHTGRPDGSRRNLLRLGFEEIGTEPGYVWNVETGTMPARRRG
jgi:GNAT superfamily N-acetyltransferase